MKYLRTSLLMSLFTFGGSSCKSIEHDNHSSELATTLSESSPMVSQLKRTATIGDRNLSDIYKSYDSVVAKTIRDEFAYRHFRFRFNTSEISADAKPTDIVAAAIVRGIGNEISGLESNVNLSRGRITESNVHEYFDRMLGAAFDKFFLSQPAASKVRDAVENAPKFVPELKEKLIGVDTKQSLQVFTGRLRHYSLSDKHGFEGPFTFAAFVDKAEKQVIVFGVAAYNKHRAERPSEDQD